MKIGILGIGAVGGFFGGKLAETFAGSDVEVVFLARENTAEAIQKEGFRMKLPTGDVVVHPTTSADGAGVGSLDVLFVTTKSYHLETALRQFSNCIAPKTLIIPLLNGVDARGHIQQMFPQNTVADGCVYLVARKTGDNEITQTGDIQKLYFGSAGEYDERFLKVHDCLIKAGITSTLSPHIETDVWEKYIFISTIATATTYFDQNLGGLLTNPDRIAFMESLLTEICTVATAHRIAIPPNAHTLTMRKIHAMPHHVTTSMHSDAQAGRPTEYLSLTAYIAHLGRHAHIATPTFDAVMQVFGERWGEIQ